MQPLRPVDTMTSSHTCLTAPSCSSLSMCSPPEQRAAPLAKVVINYSVIGIEVIWWIWCFSIQYFHIKYFYFKLMHFKINFIISVLLMGVSNAFCIYTLFYLSDFSAGTRGPTKLTMIDVCSGIRGVCKNKLPYSELGPIVVSLLSGHKTTPNK